MEAHLDSAGAAGLGKKDREKSDGKRTDRGGARRTGNGTDGKLDPSPMKLERRDSDQ
jgi:hypothetical protein